MHFIYAVSLTYNSPPLPSIIQHLSYDDCLEDKRENFQNGSAMNCVTQLCTMICTLIWAVLTHELFFRIEFLRFTRASLFLLELVTCILCTSCFFCLVVSISAINCLERLISEMTYYASHGTLNPSHLLTHLLTQEALLLQRNRATR